MEKFNKVDVVLLLAEVFLEEVVDGTFDQERVVDRDEAHFLFAEPARLAATGHTPVHDIVGDEEVGLKLYEP